MLGETGLSTAKPYILPKNYHIGVYRTTHEPYTGAVIRYAITDRTLFSPQYAHRRLARGGEGQDELTQLLARRCADLARAGIDFIQLREKDLPPDEIVHLGKAVLAAIRAVGSHTRLLLNVENDLSAALLIGTNGVHLTSASQLSMIEIAERFQSAGHPVPYVSRSCHTLAEVKHAQSLGVSAILFGPVFGKSVRGKAVLNGIGLDRLAEACALAGDVPVLALGGVTQANAADCVAAGAAGIAAIRLFMLP